MLSEQNYRHHTATMMQAKSCNIALIINNSPTRRLCQASATTGTDYGMLRGCGKSTDVPILQAPEPEALTKDLKA